MARPRSFDLEEVLDRSVQIFWTRGYADTSISDLEEDLGIGRQSLYNLFGDKKGLFLAVLDRYRARNRELLEALGDPDGGLPAIRSYFGSLVDFLAVEGRSRGCLLTRSLIDHADDTQVARRCRDNGRRLQEAFEAALAVAAARGEVDSTADSTATARLLVSQTYGLSAVSREGASRTEMMEGVEALLDRL